MLCPCGHYCCCNECANAIQNSSTSKCPTYRSDIGQIVKKETKFNKKQFKNNLQFKLKSLNLQ